MSDETYTDIIHYNTDQIVCPACGYYYANCDDFIDEEGTESCVNCGSRFKYRKNIFITWETDLLET
jgi:hypothetical protein